MRDTGPSAARSGEAWLCALIVASGALICDGVHAQAAPDAPPAPVAAEAASSTTTAPAEASPPAPEAPLASEPAAPASEAAVSAEATTDDGATAAGWGDMSAFAEAEEADAPVFRAKLYGFIDTHLEKQAKSPSGVDSNGKTEYERNAYEFDIPNLHVMVQGALYEKYKFFVNLAGPGSGSNVGDTPIAVRNAWMEAPLVGRYLNVRAGKTYRRFGLYNEILDAVPTFIGIEPPEIFDNDHLMLTRTTNLMVHGSTDAGPAVVNYSLTTGNDERLPKSVPIGGDVNVEFSGFKLGTSFYFSGGPAAPSRAVGDGSPKGGVINWMDRDKYRVLGAYAQYNRHGWILQAEYWRAHHDAKRNQDALAQMFDDGSLNPAQLRRFFVDGDPDAGARTSVKYDIQTFYFRGGYEFTFGKLSSITPYVQMDYYENPETVDAKSLGGDAEAGATDDGKFQKYTIGAVFRPVPQVALKVDGSAHVFQFNDATEYYPEVRSSFSYLWELAQ